MSKPDAAGGSSPHAVVLTPEVINSWIMEPAACQELLKKIPPQLMSTAEDSQTSL